MSRYVNPPIDALLGAMPKWKQRCVIEGQGLFVDQQVWTPDAFDDLMHHYIDAPDVGEGNFLDKLSQQLSGASVAAKWLAVDLAWLLYLFPRGSIGPAKKVENLSKIVKFGGQSLPPGHWALEPEVLKGIGSTGTFFNTGFWIEYSFAMLVLHQLVCLPAAQRVELMMQDADLMAWLDGLSLPEQLPAGVPVSPPTRMFRHMWLYLMQPDQFERISSTGQKRQIVIRLAPQLGLKIDLSTPRRVDELLLEIRRTLETQHATSDLDFYEPPLRALWIDSAAPTESPAGVTELPATKPDPGPFGDANGKSCWLVGSYIDDVDQTETFVAEGRWCGVVAEALLNKVKSVKAGDRIAIKSSYTQKHGLPFDAKGKVVSCMAIKARGVVTHNPGDGLNLSVDWEQGFKPFVIYHFTYRSAVARIDARRWPEPIRWIFEGKLQPLGAGLVIDDDEEEDAPDEPALSEAGATTSHNLILYGPPGTGKTYTTIDEALRLIDPGFVTAHIPTHDDHQSRSAFKARFDELVSAGRVRFVTFHQSLSYEDFVEGLRAGENPTSGATGPSFRVEPGLFRQFCLAAARSALPHVLVIDEINRGNVSRIFGELLTLIEPGKRAGQPEALEVTLPYSRQRFSVPANVHLIGTMNTADRSLAGLDIALRRRFTFKEMPPRPELLDDVTVEGVNLGALLRVMNERIELLLDRDHLLGHAYLLPLAIEGEATLPRLAEVFRQQIVPLLQEYFFEDWERIGWVLNDPAKAAENRFVLQGGARTATALFGAKVAEQLSDRRWRLNDAAFNRIESYRGILVAANPA